MTTNTTLYDREEAARRAEAATTNDPDTCQLWTRTMIGAPSAGDVDGDGASDAEDGWKSEPAKYRHTDRKPPRGTPVSYLGGSSDNGHRAISLGPIGGVYMIRSTDANGRGRVATVPLDWPERSWGLKYAGWSETCDGYLIPVPVVAAPSSPATSTKKPSRWRTALTALTAVVSGSPSKKRRRKARKALKELNR